MATGHTFTPSLLPLLDERKNLGFHDDFGRAGRIRRFSRALGEQKAAFRFIFDIDDEQDDAHLVISANTLRGKQLHERSPALRNGARIFLTRIPESDYDEVFFVEDKRELILLLRLNLRFLQTRNDARSHRLFRRITGIPLDVARLDDELCLELCDLRTESIPHIRKMLEKMEGSRLLLEALDRGELLSLFRSFSGSPVQVAGALNPNETAYLISVVRARYFPRMQGHVSRFGRSALTPLGRKLAARASADTFTLEEKRILLSLALRASSARITGALARNGQQALLHKMPGTSQAETS